MSQEATPRELLEYYVCDKDQLMTKESNIPQDFCLLWFWFYPALYNSIYCT